MLSDFFRINLPYGISRTDDNEWFAFNREYLPLGWNDSDKKDTFHIEKDMKQCLSILNIIGLQKDF